MDEEDCKKSSRYWSTFIITLFNGIELDLDVDNFVQHQVGLFIKNAIGLYVRLSNSRNFLWSEGNT